MYGGWSRPQYFRREVVWPDSLLSRIAVTASQRGTTVTSLIAGIVNNTTVEELEQAALSVEQSLDRVTHRTLYWPIAIEKKLAELAKLSCQGIPDTDEVLLTCVYLKLPAIESTLRSEKKSQK